MTLDFDAIAAKFDAQRRLPAEAIASWLRFVDEVAAGRTLTIIEPGIGTGRISLPSAIAGHHVVGSDISDGMLSVCAARAESLGAADRVTLTLADAAALPETDGSADLGVIAQLLYLVPNWTDVLEELDRVVRPGGTIVHLTEDSDPSPALQEWSERWREIIELTGFRHTSLRPTDAELRAEWSRRWPDHERRALAQWSFGQTVAAARDRYAERLRPLYADVAEGDWQAAVAQFLAWSQRAFPDETLELSGSVMFNALIGWR